MAHIFDSIRILNSEFRFMNAFCRCLDRLLLPPGTVVVTLIVVHSGYAILRGTRNLRLVSIRVRLFAEKRKKIT